MENWTSQIPPTKVTNVTSTCPSYVTTKTEFFVQAGIFAVFLVASLFGNSIVIAIVCRIQKLKTSTGLFIVNLCISEILGSLFKINLTIIIKILAGLGNNKIYYVNDALSFVLCTFTASFMDMFCHDLAIISLTLIAVDRFLAVKYPLRKYLDQSRAKKLIVATWLAAFVIASPFLYSTTYKHNSDGSLTCGEDWYPFPANSTKIYTLCHVGLFLFVPLCVMGILYSITIYKVWVRRIPGNVTPANQLLEHKTKVNVVKMCLTVVVMFAVCWTPLYVWRIAQSFLWFTCPPHPHLDISLVALSFTFHVINPIIYFAFSRDYRNGFWDIMKCCKK